MRWVHASWQSDGGKKKVKHQSRRSTCQRSLKSLKKKKKLTKKEHFLEQIITRGKNQPHNPTIHSSDTRLMVNKEDNDFAKAEMQAKCLSMTWFLKLASQNLR